MRQTLSDEGCANILANFLGNSLEPLVDADNGGQVHGVDSLPLGLMEAICNNLRIRSDFPDAYVLSPRAGGEHHITPDELNRRVSDNPDAHLVVFLPEEFRTTHETAFDPHFFTRFDTFQGLETVEGQLIGKINKVPVYKRVATLWSNHAATRLPILKRVDYLINVISLCLEAGEMGTFFHKLDLIPDRNPDATGNFPDRLARNVVAVTLLCNRELPAAERVASLNLADPELAARLVPLLDMLGQEITPDSLAVAVFEAETAEAVGLTFEHWRFAGETGWS
ncbi:MAG: hypothetical protein ACE5FN_06375 [Leptospirillia bacterium]